METPGQYLKAAREAQKILPQKVAEDTHISLRHIKALEEDNYSIFPGETYTKGFLKQYSNYLNLNEDHVLQLYRSSLLEQVESPLDQLTKPTITSLDYIVKYAKIFLIPLVIVLVTFIGYLFYQNQGESRPERTNHSAPSNLQAFLSKSDTIPDKETEHISLNAKYPSNAVILPQQGINFSLLNTEVYVILEKLYYRQESGGQSSVLVEVYPGRTRFKLYENKPLVIHEDNIPHEFTLTLRGATPNNIKLQVEADIQEAVEAAKKTSKDPGITESRITNPSNYIIRFEAYTTGQNFVEFYVDGQPQKKGLLPKDSRILYEANESIQMKIGDAGAIKIRINGKDYNFGKRGQQVKKIILKEKDPLQQTKFRVVVKDA